MPRESGASDALRPDLSIVLATLNEAGSLLEVLQGLEKCRLTNYEVVVVDDGSSDGTLDILKSWAEQHTNVRALLNDHRQTLLRAHYQGIREAVGDRIVVMDADLQHPVSSVNAMADSLASGFDLAIGTRYVDGGSTGNRRVVRGLESRVAAELAHTLLPQTRQLSDPMSGFFGFRAALARNLPPPRQGIKFLLYLLAYNPSARIAEVPFRFEERRTGRSKIVDGGPFTVRFLFELLNDYRLSSSERERHRGRPVRGEPVSGESSQNLKV